LKPSFACISKGFSLISETRGLAFGHNVQVDLIIFLVIVHQKLLSRGIVKKHLFFSKYYEIYDYLKMKFSPNVGEFFLGLPIYIFSFNIEKYENIF